MKNDNCKQIEELLVDFADGELNGLDLALVREHLDSCQSCAGTAKALKESLSMAELIWDDNLSEPATKRLPFNRYIQIAAGILFVIGMFFAYNPNPKNTTPPPTEIAQATQLPSFAEIEYQIAMEGIAARLMAKAEMIKQNPDRIPNADKHIQNEYRHIVAMYPETLTAKKAAKLINKI
jgi:hypothetical protein